MAALKTTNQSKLNIFSSVSPQFRKSYFCKQFMAGLVLVALPCALWQKEKTFIPGTADDIST